jgi:SnoaL-like protein
VAVATPDTAADTRRRLRAAVERGDHAAAVSLFADDIVLNSPIIGSARFEGREAVGNLMGAVIETFDDLHYTAEGEAGELQVLAFRARVRGRDIETVDLIRVNDAGLITEFTVLIRPMAGLAAVAVALGPHIGRGPVRSFLARALAAPLALLLRIAEPLIPRLIRTR